MKTTLGLTCALTGATVLSSVNRTTHPSHVRVMLSSLPVRCFDCAGAAASALVASRGPHLRRFPLVSTRQLRRSQPDGQLVELAGETEWHLVVVVVRRRSR